MLDFELNEHETILSKIFVEFMKKPLKTIITNKDS